MLNGEENLPFKKENTDVFKEYIGESGRYQIYLVVILSLSALCSVSVFREIIFVKDVKPHWCALPEYAHPAFYNLGLEERLSLTIPMIKVENKWIRDSCHMHGLNYSVSPERHVNMRSNNNTNIVKCSSWEFDKSELKNTLVEKVRKTDNFLQLPYYFILRPATSSYHSEFK